MRSDPDEETLKKIVTRNLTEITTAEYNCLILLEMEKANIDYTCDCGFFYLAYWALRNDAFARLIRVLDIDDRSATFRDIYQHYSVEIDQELCRHGWSYKMIDEFYTKKLRLIRVKTHFHLDEQCIVNPQEVWNTADIKGDEFTGIIKAVRASLQRISETGPLPYDGTDVFPILIASQNAGLLKLNFGEDD